MRKIFYTFPSLVRLYHFAVAFCGACLYRFPGRKIFVIGVTGTKGKTTTLELLNAILEEAGKKTALLSSIFVKIGAKREKNETANTMPGHFFLHHFLRRAVREGCAYAVVEVTSQGVALSRHRFIKWGAAALTNIAPEHIEAHGSFEKYRNAKLVFLKAAMEDGAPIFINGDNAPSRFFVEALGGRNTFVYSTALLREAFLKNPVFEGEFYAQNVAAAVAVVRQIGIGEETIARALQKFAGVPGRMEFVRPKDGRPLPFEVVVDYAHTPDSLRAVYTALRARLVRGRWDAELALWKKTDSAPDTAPSPGGRLLCVLGAAGGGRDRWKRPEMGKIAAEFCDAIIVTDEDPYDEDPAAILSEIKGGVSQEKVSATREILDRREALKEAIASAREGDIVIATGKGSEEWIHVAKGKKVAWSERATVEALLREPQK